MRKGKKREGSFFIRSNEKKARREKEHRNVAGWGQLTSLPRGGERKKKKNASCRGGGSLSARKDMPTSRMDHHPGKKKKKGGEGRSRPKEKYSLPHFRGGLQQELGIPGLIRTEKARGRRKERKEKFLASAL